MPAKSGEKKVPYTVYLPHGQAVLFDRLVKSEIYGDSDSDVIRHILTNELKELFEEEWKRLLKSST